MQFKSIIGQKKVKQQLLKSVEDNRVPHAQLFLGAEGVGTLPLALAFAQYLNCENRQPDDSCGKCPSCIKSQKLIHPDIFYTFPVYKRKKGSDSPALSNDFIKEWREAISTNPYMNTFDWLEYINSENKQGNISAEECKSLIHRFNMKTFESKYKILILWRAEYLSKEGNILLKLLEEPPANSIFLLLAENQEQILSTILSRTQLVKIPKLHDEEIYEELADKFSAEEKNARQIARTANGNFNEALRLLKNTENDSERLLLQMFRICAQKNRDVQMMNEMIEELSKTGRENQKSFFRYGLSLMREIIVLHHLGSDHTRLTEDEIRLAVFLNERMSFSKKEKIIKQFNDSYYEIERNANPRILFFNLFIQLGYLLKNNKVVLANP